MIVLWDRDCGFCAFMLSLMLRADSKRVLRPAVIQGPEGEKWLAAMPAEQRLATFHAVDAGGRVTSGGEALTVLLRELPAARPLAALTGAAPGVTDRAYTWVAANRPLLSKPIPAAAKQRARGLVARRTRAPGR